MRSRAYLVLALTLVLGFYAAATFVPQETRRESALLPDEGMRLGLDLQGGIHWVLGADLDVAVAHELEHLRGRFESELTDQKITPSRLAVEGPHLVIELSKPEDVERARTLAADTNVLQPVESAGTRLVYQLTDQWRKDVRDKGMLQVLEVLRRRIEDPIQGIQDSVVTRQGDDRILVQIPGGQMDRSRARELLAVTGFLEFKIVQDSAPSEELLAAKHKQGLPDGSEIVVERDKKTNRTMTAYLVRKAPDLTGDYLSDARVQFDRQQRPVVGFQFNAEGGKIFGELTEKNVGKPLAIVLDKQVYSAPQIRERIGSQGQIEGRFTSQQAADLAVVLRSGSLAIPVKIEEERTVGPALGADAIRSGALASAASLVAVFVFALLYYRLSGVYAAIAVSLNLVYIVAIMALFRSTLTLPGLAGLVLTVGMAIDGNVLIFERIREELRRGRTPRAAIKAGFERAILPILDGNLTTLITAIVLYQFGTGPIKGFAVTLAIGLVTTVFTAVIVTRVLFALWPGERRVSELSI
jgi:preprotein translocase subunit SecD